MHYHQAHFLSRRVMSLSSKRDMSLPWTMLVSQPVIMGFIIQPYTVLVSLYTWCCTQKRSKAEIAEELQTGFMTTLKEIYASKQNILNPQAWISVLGGNIYFATTQQRMLHFLGETQEEKGDFICMLLGAESYTYKWLQQHFFPFKSLLYIQTE